MRMAMREGSLDDLAADSTTSPEKIAPSGMTVPLTSVASVSFASTFVPTGVFPAATFWRIVTGNSCAEAALGAAEPEAGAFDCPNRKMEPEINPSETRPSAVAKRRRGRNFLVGMCGLLQSTPLEAGRGSYGRVYLKRGNDGVRNDGVAMAPLIFRWLRSAPARSLCWTVCWT